MLQKGLRSLISVSLDFKMAQFTADITKGPELLTAAEERPIRCGFFFFFRRVLQVLQHRTKVFLLYHKHHCIFMGNVLVLEKVLEQDQPNCCWQLFFFLS